MYFNKDIRKGQVIAQDDVSTLRPSKKGTPLLEFYTKEFGFHKDGELRDNHFMDGRWWNSHIYSLLEKEYIK